MSFSMFSHRAIFVLSKPLENIRWISGLHIEIFRRFSKFTKNLAVHEINTKQKFSEPRNICLAPDSVNKPFFFYSFSKKRVAVCKDAMVKSLNNVLYVSFVFSTGKSVWHNVTFLSVWPVIHQIIKCDFVMLYEVPVCHFYVCCTVHIKK